MRRFERVERDFLGREPVRIVEGGSVGEGGVLGNGTKL